MTVITVGSVAGSPGATRLAMGLAASWAAPATRRVLVEADPDGGRLGAELGVGVEPGLMALAVAARTSRLTTDGVVERAGAPVAGWHLVPAPPSPEQAYSALVHAATSLAQSLSLARDALWVVDAGRLTSRSPSLAFARASDVVLVVTSGAFPELQLVPARVDSLRRAGCRPAVVVRGPTSWSAAEIAEFVGADVLAVLPRARGSRDGVVAMRASGWRSWWRAVDALGRHLAAVPAPGASTADRARPPATSDTHAPAGNGAPPLAAPTPRPSPAVGT